MELDSLLHGRCSTDLSKGVADLRGDDSDRKRQQAPSGAASAPSTNLLA